MKAVGYVRVSTQEQSTDGVSLAAQVASIERYCAYRELEVEIITDPGVSASIPLKERPGGARLLEMLANGEAGIVVAVKLDRLFRDVIDCLSTLQSWEREKTGLHLVDMGGQAVDTSSAMGKFFIGMMAQVAEMERNLIRERTIAALRHKQRLGERTGSIPYGYRVEPGNKLLLRDDDEQFVISDIVGMTNEGLSIRQIAEKLNAMEVPPRGERWHHTTIARILQRQENP